MSHKVNHKETEYAEFLIRFVALFHASFLTKELDNEIESI